MVDCAGAFDNNGCNGGLPSHAFEYLRYEGGMSSELNYPYTAVDGTCQDEIVHRVGTKGSVNITAGNEVELKQELFAHGPVSVAFQVYGDFSSYTSGVYTSDECGTTASDVNHAVLAVGYGHDDESGMDYWIVKNSWGEDWGDEGYFKIQRGENICGIAQCNSYPLEVFDARDALVLE